MSYSSLSTSTVKDMMRSPNRVYNSYQDLLRDCQKWRKYYNHQEVYPLEESLRLESVVTLPLKGCPSPGDVAAGLRLPPPLLRLDANRSERTLDVKLVLTRPLRDEKLARPHTWLADMVAVDDQDSKTSVGRVVLKIAQQSRMVIPDTSDRNRNISRLRVPHYITLVAHDFLMFEKLEHLQGGIIPYSYGLHQIKMPNDEDAYVFITEYIEGRTLTEWMSENAHPAELPIPSAVLTEYFMKRAPMLPRLLKAITTLHENDVIHCDLHVPDHVLLTDSVGAGVVFVNLHSAVTEDRLQKGETMKGLMAWEITELLDHVPACCCAHMRMIGRWMRVHDMLKVMSAEDFFRNYDISDEGPETERNEYEAMKTLRARGYLDID